jgi:hypothetical protein
VGRDPLRVSDIEGAAAGTAQECRARSRFARPSAFIDVSDICGPPRGHGCPLPPRPASAFAACGRGAGGGGGGGLLLG